MCDMKRVLLGLILCLSAQVGFAQTYPAKPIRLVIPWPPGGPSDLVGRIFSERLSKVLGQPIVVDNRGGANGSIGADAVAHAAPDGYTLMVQNMTSQAMFPATIKKLGFDPVADFEPITQIAASPLIVVANPSFPAANMAEFVAQARAKPGSISVASFGQGSGGHLGIELLMKLAGIRVNHIPYKGGAPAATDTVAGHTQAAIVGLPVALPFVKQGRLRALAVTTAARAPQLPEVPTVSETRDLASYELGLMYGFLAPAKTPGPIVSLLHAAAVEVLRTPEFEQRMIEQGLGSPIANSPAAMAAAMRRDVEVLGSLAKAAGIEPE
jgi:tripartite-type tricarboxylate transporter receptor subunit TctC